MASYRAPIDLTTLRQYLDVTANMIPVPEIHVQPAPQARLQDVETVLATMRMANLRGIVLLGIDLRTGQQFEMYTRFSLAGELAP